jgi:DNA-binding MarR family transcriptional regulator
MNGDDIARLRNVIHKLSRQFNISATDEGLTPAQASALGLIASDGPLTIVELIDIEGLNPSMVSRIVGHLAESGFVARRADPQDGRAGLVEITEAGAQTFARIKAARGEVVSEYLGRLSTVDRDAILAVLPALEALAVELRFRPLATNSARRAARA